MKKIIFINGLLALAWVAATSAAPGWRLVWSDEFTQTNGSAPDALKWTFDLGGHGWGNNELQTYTSRKENCRIENNALVIEARAEKFTGPDGLVRNYTSARIKTKTRAAWESGRMEARMKVPEGKGVWPAFWMLGTNIDSVGWPGCGEIDIMENIGREPDRVHGTIHGPGYSGANGVSGQSVLATGKVADKFHLFAVEWTGSTISWFMDGKKYFTASPASLPASSAWVFNQPQFILLNFAVGGDWPGAPEQADAFPKQMLVDYVRVYAWE